MPPRFRWRRSRFLSIEIRLRTQDCVMAHFEFQWTDEIVDHLAEHNVQPEEFEEIVSFPDRRANSRSSGSPLAPCR